MSKDAIFVTDSDQVIKNIRNYQRQLTKHSELKARLSMHKAWYANQDDEGQWWFAPSKFIGYVDMTPLEYLKRYGKGLNGGPTEDRLEKMFELISPESDLGVKLFGQLRTLLARFGKIPHKNSRIRLVGEIVSKLPSVRAASDEPLERIVSNPGICGGRPCVRGTRMRVSDIVDMLGHGATESEILADFPYIKADDIKAALIYAARAMDHPVVRAA
ncbi:MAG: DUF433 domain-containing protein [Aestuariivirga sp.]